MSALSFGILEDLLSIQRTFEVLPSLHRGDLQIPKGHLLVYNQSTDVPHMKGFLVYKNSSTSMESHRCPSSFESKEEARCGQNEFFVQVYIRSCTALEVDSGQVKSGCVVDCSLL